MKKKLFIQSVFPAPYRAGLFKKLSEFHDVFVVFERNEDINRSEEWFIKEFNFKTVVLGSTQAKKIYNNEKQMLNKYDVVLAYDYASMSSIKLMITCIIIGVPYIINCDGAFIRRNFIKNLVKRFFITRAIACLASGEHAENYFLTYGAKKENIYRHNFSGLNKEDILKEPISLEGKKIIREKLGLSANKKIVLSVGQFAYRKGYDVLLNAWKSMDQCTTLVLIGGGDKETEYRKFVANNKMKNVIIHGYQPKNILSEYYKAADLFVLPTREDIWGLVVNEAMAFGLPVVTTSKCIAGLELINNYENGFIVPVEDSNAITEKAKLILNDSGLANKMADNNIKKIQDYTIGKMAERHCEIIEAKVQ